MNAVSVALFLLTLLAAAPAPVPTADAPPPTGDRLDEFWDLQWRLGPLPGAPRTRPPPPSRELTALGRSLFRDLCASCHGERGDGKGPDASRLRVAPTNFVQGAYKLRSTPSPSLPTDKDLFVTLTRGVHGTPMLPWRSLDEKERWALVAHLKSLSTRFRDERPLAPIRIPRPPREDDALRERGRRLYAFLECASCHGDAGAADGPTANDRRQWEPNRDMPIRDFTRGRFIRGTEMQDIFLTLQTGLDGTPMDSYNAILGDDEIWAVAAYVRSLVHDRSVHQFPPAGAGTSTREWLKKHPAGGTRDRRRARAPSRSPFPPGEP